MEKHKPQEVSENNESEYMGNIWGWKFSFVSLGIIVAMILLMGIRYLTMDKGTMPENLQTTTEKDSLINKTTPID